MPSDFDLRSLDAEPPTPSTVDIERAIADGRRRRARRGAGYAGAATLTAVARRRRVGRRRRVVHRRPAGCPDDRWPASPPPAYTIPGTPGWTRAVGDRADELHARPAARPGRRADGVDVRRRPHRPVDRRPLVPEGGRLPGGHLARRHADEGALPGELEE